MSSKFNGRLTEREQNNVQVAYETYKPYVCRVARAVRTLSPEDLEEVVQEVFLALSIAAAKHTLPPERGQVFKWLKTTTRRQAARLMQKRSLRGVIELPVGEQISFAEEEELAQQEDTREESNPEFVCLQNESRRETSAYLELLPQAIEQLPYREKVILKADLYGQSRQKAAQSARIPQGQIGMYAKRGRARLLAELSLESSGVPSAA